MSETHEIELAAVPFEWPGYLAVCTCRNYTSKPFETRAGAQRAGKHHIAEHTRHDALSPENKPG